MMKVEAPKTMEVKVQDQIEHGFNIRCLLPDLRWPEPFTGRSNELEELATVLLPSTREIRPDARHETRPEHRHKIFVLHGPRGVGKTRLAFEFARLKRDNFSAVFWLDGSSEERLKASIADHANRLPRDQSQHPSWTDASGGGLRVDDQIHEVYSWLEREHNFKWILIIDGVNTASGLSGSPYNIKKYLPRADQGSILITTRLSSLGISVQSRELQPPQIATSRARPINGATILRSLDYRLRGSQLALMQAKAYMQASGKSVEEYAELYTRQEQELAQPGEEEDKPLRSSADWKVWTTSAIAFEAVREEDPWAANLLTLWSFLSNRDLWFSLFDGANKLDQVSNILCKWIDDLGQNKSAFEGAMQVLECYALIEKGESTDDGPQRYAIRSVVHRWAYWYHRQRDEGELLVLLIIVLGYALPEDVTPDSAEEPIVQQHAEVCLNRLQREGGSIPDWMKRVGDEKQRAVVAEHFLEAFFRLFDL
ncbi:hypothetical protein K461DRAFT_321447 [Myriangium duriaei CBS 260.36]|uniref:NB-ARC domain-containing protein n=1 Tax=Myriangium duriaei CBS 260.36 TaxID=1168546 RepID=A0A9P4J4V0_9PEZI|nr:hypothetical protein K461DRAFT_321447 [Myriangium duriaei CBS 260.36]